MNKTIDFFQYSCYNIIRIEEVKYGVYISTNANKTNSKKG